MLILFVIVIVTISLFPFFFLILRRPPRSTLFPYTTLSDLEISPPGTAAVAQRSPSTWDSVSVLVCHSSSMRRGDSALKIDRKSTRLNSSHMSISYAVFCLKKKKKQITQTQNQYEQ